MGVCLLDLLLRTVFVKEWSLHQQSASSGDLLKRQILRPTQVLLNQTLRKWSPLICVSSSPLDDSDVVKLHQLAEPLPENNLLAGSEVCPFPNTWHFPTSGL